MSKKHTSKSAGKTARAKSGSTSKSSWNLYSGLNSRTRILALISAIIVVLFVGFIGYKKLGQSNAFGTCQDVPCAAVWASNVDAHNRAATWSAVTGHLYQPGNYRADFQCTGQEVSYGGAEIIGGFLTSAVDTLVQFLYRTQSKTDPSRFRQTITGMATTNPYMASKGMAAAHSIDAALGPRDDNSSS